MYRIIKLMESILRICKNKAKILFWKIKYGKRIKIGKNLQFKKNLIINISKNGYLEIGDNNFLNNYCSINCHNKIYMGSNNSFGENVKLYDHNHEFDTEQSLKQRKFKTNPIYIYNNNWIGSNCIILSKCQLGDYNVIGAGTILNEKIGNKMIIKTTRQVEKKNINFKD